MKLIIGGSMAIVLSILGFGYHFSSFVKLVAGVVPVLLLLGGCVALYLYREMKDDHNDDDHSGGMPVDSPPYQAAAPEHKETPASVATTPETMDSKAEAPPETQEPVEIVEASSDEQPGTVGAEKAIDTETVSPVKEEEKETPVDEEKREEETIEPDKEENTEPEYKFIGNVGSMVFHTPDCKFSTGKNCTAFFESKDEALEAGYRACGTCKP